MSMLPYLLDHLEHPSPRPTRLINQHFGHGLTHEDLSSPLVLHRDLRALLSSPHYYRPWKHTSSSQDAGSTIHFDKDKFEVNLDVQQFAPEEISVKVTGDNVITVEGKHEEKEDEHGFISRHFVRRYILPKGHNIEKIQSKLSSDGVLTIVAPKMLDEQAEHRHIQIEHTGKPSRPVETKKIEENGEN